MIGYSQLRLVDFLECAAVKFMAEQNKMSVGYNIRLQVEKCYTDGVWFNMALVTVRRGYAWERSYDANKYFKLNPYVVIGRSA